MAARHPTGRTCRICIRPYLAKGFCRKHYQRWYRHGDPYVVNPPGPRPARYLLGGRS